MFKQSANAIGMLISQYRCVLKKMFLKNAAALAASALIFCAAPVMAADYIVGSGSDPSANKYENLEALRVAGVSFADGDTVTMYATDASLTDALDFQGKAVTVKPSGTGIRFLYLTSGQTLALDNASHVVISGFNNDDYGGAVRLSNSALTANNATINLGAGAGQTSVFSGNYVGTTANSIYFDGSSGSAVTLNVTGAGTLAFDMDGATASTTNLILTGTTFDE